MIYKQVVPCIFIHNGKAVKWFNDDTVISDDVVQLAKYYSDNQADELLVFDLSSTDEEHEVSIDLLKKINREIGIPMTAGGNISRLEDVKKILYAGAKRAMFNLSKPHSLELVKEAAERFGKDKIAVSLNDFDTLFKQQKIIEEYCGKIFFMHRLDLNSISNITELPFIIVTDTDVESELYRILKNDNVRGISGLYVSDMEFNIPEFKNKYAGSDIAFSAFESKLDFEDFKLDANGLIPVIVQDYKSNQVLMMAYMNKESYEFTIKNGKMCYYSRSRQQLWLKGETSGHYQFVKSLIIDCDMDTILAKVAQVGAACHTGSPTCFFTPMVEGVEEEKTPLQIFESVYDTIADRKINPKQGSYTNYLFDKGIDKILKKVGEEATELVIAAKNPNPEEIKYELSDFLYHAMVLMVERGVTWDDIIKELADR